MINIITLLCPRTTLLIFTNTVFYLGLFQSRCSLLITYYEYLPLMPVKMAATDFKKVYVTQEEMKIDINISDLFGKTP